MPRSRRARRDDAPGLPQRCAALHSGRHLPSPDAAGCSIPPNRLSSRPGPLAVHAGTERCEEAVRQLGERYDLVVNIQGDEPLIEPECIDAVVTALQDSPDAVYRWVGGWAGARKRSVLGMGNPAGLGRRGGQGLQPAPCLSSLIPPPPQPHAARHARLWPTPRCRCGSASSASQVGCATPRCHDVACSCCKCLPAALLRSACSLSCPPRAAAPDVNGYAIYFSRGVLPYNKDGEVRCGCPLPTSAAQLEQACCVLCVYPHVVVSLSFFLAGRRNYPAPWHDKPYLLHLGLQCYDRAFLRQYSSLAPTPLQVGRLERPLHRFTAPVGGPGRVAAGGSRIPWLTHRHCAC